MSAGLMMTKEELDEALRYAGSEAPRKERQERLGRIQDHIVALAGQLKKAEKERDNLGDELADLQCDIASAFGWSLEGEKFVDAIRRTIAENAVLKKRIKAN